MTHVILALGSNRSGPWGNPMETLKAGLHRLQRSGVAIIRVSHIYQTAPVGGGRQPPYVNLVLVGRANQAPASLLHVSKQVERESGRRLGRRWGPRTLDIDIVMAGHVVYGWPARQAGRLTIPHPEAHKRAFVLVPLLDVAPDWVHPGLGLTVRQLLARTAARDRRGVRRLIEPARGRCDDPASRLGADHHA